MDLCILFAFSNNKKFYFRPRKLYDDRAIYLSVFHLFDVCVFVGWLFLIFHSSECMHCTCYGLLFLRGWWRCVRAQNSSENIKIVGPPHTKTECKTTVHKRTKKCHTHYASTVEFYSIEKIQLLLMFAVLLLLLFVCVCNIETNERNCLLLFGSDAFLLRMFCMYLLWFYEYVLELRLFEHSIVRGCIFFFVFSPAKNNKKLKCFLWLYLFGCFKENTRKTIYFNYHNHFLMVL